MPLYCGGFRLPPRSVGIPVGRSEPLHDGARGWQVERDNLSSPLPHLATSQWNLNFALLPLISQWEFTHNRTAAIAALPLIAAATDWWACYLTRVPANGSYIYHDNNTFLPDNEHENQADADPQVG